MFIETPVKAEISSVGAACEPGTCRSYGACEFCQQNHYKHDAPTELVHGKLSFLVFFVFRVDL